MCKWAALRNRETFAMVIARLLDVVLLFVCFFFQWLFKGGFRGCFRLLVTYKFLEVLSLRWLLVCLHGSFVCL